MATQRREHKPRGRGNVTEDDELDDELDDDELDDEIDETGRDSELSAAEAAEVGRREVTRVIKKTAEGVSSVERAEDGWIVQVEVVEDRHIPSSSDVLALYEVDIDSAGTLLAYRRTRRYSRGRGDSEAT